MILWFSCLDRKCAAPQDPAYSPPQIHTFDITLGKSARSSLGRSYWYLSTIPIINVSLMLGPSAGVINRDTNLITQPCQCLHFGIPNCYRLGNF